MRGSCMYMKRSTQADNSEHVYRKTYKEWNLI